MSAVSRARMVGELAQAVTAAAALEAAERKLLLARIVASYRSRVVRAYCRARFLIIRQGFLDEIGQYLPDDGYVLDVGCGFGLFGLYFAGSRPGRSLQGYDLNEKRVGMARQAAESLGIPNACFAAGDATSLSLDRSYDAAYTLDTIHHLPRDFVPSFLTTLHEALRPGGRLIIKDVDTRPAYKRWFTLAADRLMVGLGEPIHYWSSAELRALLEQTGFDVFAHTIRDVLPYPHQLYVCSKR